MATSTRRGGGGAASLQLQIRFQTLIREGPPTREQLRPGRPFDGYGIPVAPGRMRPDEEGFRSLPRSTGIRYPLRVMTPFWLGAPANAAFSQGALLFC